MSSKQLLGNNNALQWTEGVEKTLPCCTHMARAHPEMVWCPSHDFTDKKIKVTKNAR